MNGIAILPALLLVSIFLVVIVLLGKATIVLLAHPGVLLVGGGVLLAFLLLVALGMTRLSFQPHTKVAAVPAVPAVPQPIVQVPQAPQAVQQIREYSGVQTVVGVAHWLTLSGVIWLVFVIGCVVAFVARRIFFPAACAGRPHLWPVLLVIPVLFLFWMVGAGYQMQVQHNPAFDESVRRATAEINARQQQLSQHARERVEKLQREALSRVQKAQQSIQDEINQFDAPHIPLTPDVPAPTTVAAPAKPDPAHLTATAPAAPIAPEAPKTIDKAQAKTDSADKPTSESLPKNVSLKTKGKSKNSDKTRSKNAKQNETVGRSEPADSKDAAEPVAKDDANVEEETVVRSEPDWAKVSTKPLAQKDKKSPAAKVSDKLTATRPSWVDEPPKLMGDTQREVIATEEYATLNECRIAADMYLLLKTYERVQLLAGKPYVDSTLPSVSFSNGQILLDGRPTMSGSGNMFWQDPRLRTLDQMGIDVNYIRREIVAKEPGTNETREYVETVERSAPVGTMKKVYLQVEFTPAVDRELRGYWLASQRRDRFAAVGFGGASVLALIGLVFGLLKLDTWTKGYYSKRLFLGVPAAIIVALLLVGLVVGRPMRSDSGPTVPLSQSYSR